MVAVSSAGHGDERRPLRRSRDGSAPSAPRPSSPPAPRSPRRSGPTCCSRAGWSWRHPPADFRPGLPVTVTVRDAGGTPMTAARPARRHRHPGAPQAFRRPDRGGAARPQPSSGARSSACSAPTAPARPPPSGCCPGCWRRPRAGAGGRHRRGDATRRRCAGASATCRSASGCTTTSRWRRTCASTPGSTGWSGRAGTARVEELIAGAGLHRRGAASSPARCPAAGSSGWRWPAPRRTGPTCCSSTSRPPAWTRRRGGSSGR